IPNSEIDELDMYWDHLPGLREAVFEDVSDTHAQFREGIDVTETVNSHASVRAFTNGFSTAFDGFDTYLHDTLIDNATGVDINLVEGSIRRALFDRLRDVPIVDEYGVYQLFADRWTVIDSDLVTLQLKGWDQVRNVEPNMVVKKKDGQDTEVQDGWKGTILPFELVQRQFMPDLYVELVKLHEEQSAAEARKDELFEEIDEEDYGSGDDRIANSTDTDFKKAGVTARLNLLLEDVTSPE